MGRWTDKGIRTLKSLSAAARLSLPVGLMALSLVFGLTSSAFGYFTTLVVIPIGPFVAGVPFGVTAQLYSNSPKCMGPGQNITFMLENFGGGGVLQGPFTFPTGPGGLVTVPGSPLFFTAPPGPAPTFPNFEIVANFLGDFPIGGQGCGASTATGYFTVGFANSSLATALDVEGAKVYGGNSFTVAATLEPGFCCANQGVIITFPAQNAQVITTTERNCNATANFIAPTAPGSYPVTATFAGSPNPAPGCLPSTDTGEIIVLPPNPTTLTIKNVTVQAGGFFRAKATLGPSSCALGQSVTFLYDGVNATVTTNVGGMATATFLASDTPGISPVQVFFNGTPTCAANSNSATVTVTTRASSPSVF